jgi:sulfate transport system permease protein
MSAIAPALRATPTRTGLHDPPLVRLALIGISLLFLALFVVTPLVLVFAQAFSAGIGAFAGAIFDPVALSAMRLTLVVAAIAVPLNLAFGLAAAWLIAKFNFVGKSLLTSVIDVPLAVSPVISGMLFVLLFGARGFFGPTLREHDVQIIFAVPGIVLATIFVTFPLVAREVIPVMAAAGSDEELAALTLGASSWQTFWRITLPKIKWGVLYGVLLTNARAMGEFGAVSVVSGHIRGETNTIPLHAEILFNEYSYTGAFAMAALLALLGLGTLVAQHVLGRRARAPVSPTVPAPTVSENEA